MVVLRTDSTLHRRHAGHADRPDPLVAPALSLPVKWSIDQKTGGASEFEITADLELVSGTPQR